MNRSVTLKAVRKEVVQLAGKLIPREERRGKRQGMRNEKSPEERSLRGNVDGFRLHRNPTGARECDNVMVAPAETDGLRIRWTTAKTQTR
mmetsp:Transcript_25060/g.62684  ORF Transcript_25060/g.62684 Transcript_25060/m.62684 type:complete len:90 (+) Transcript_25060:648-917(+)